MNKKRKIIIFFIATIITGVFVIAFLKVKNNIWNAIDWPTNLFDSALLKEKNIDSEAVSSLEPELNCQSDWQEYRHDIVGIAFCYPLEWGKPIVDPIKNITRLSNMDKTFEEQNISYENSLDIIFEKNNQVSVKIFNDQYDGKSQRKINEPYVYYETGATDDITSLINGGSICDYKIGYEYKYYPEMKPDVLKTIYSDCAGGVRTVLTQNKRFFDFNDIGTLYTYDLKLLFFKKISNGYFDNVIVGRGIDHFSQAREELKTLEEFFYGKKTTEVERAIPAKTYEQFNQERKEFMQFINTMVAFKPAEKRQEDFKRISGEDQNVTVIRKYYWLITSGKLNEAYAMYADKTGTSLEKFKERYGNAYFAEPFDFKRMGDDRYEFRVKYRDHNSLEKEFHVVMDISGNIVKTIFLEEYMSEISEFGNMIAYAAKRGDKNYIFLNKGGNEIVVDQGDANYDNEYKNVSEVKFFSNPRFSPLGNYLLYNMSGWEWSVGYIYDIRGNKKIIGAVADELYGAHKFDFTADENNLYSCSGAGMARDVGGKIYSVPEFKIEYDALSDSKNKNFMGVDCFYDKNGGLVIFELSDYHSERNESQNDENLILKYNLKTKKTE